MYKMYGNFLPVHRVCLSKIIWLAFNWIIYLLPNYTHKHTYTVCVLSTYLSTVKKMTRLEIPLATFVLANKYTVNNMRQERKLVVFKLLI